MGLTFEKVGKVYEGHVAVSGFDLFVYDDELLCLLGPSGAGKTTVFRMLAGLEEPSVGDIWVDQKLVNGSPTKDRDVAMIFAKNSLRLNLTVYDNLAFGLKLRNLHPLDIQDKIKEIAEVLDITDILQQKPIALSFAQQLKVSLGRALVRQPKVLLLDEPLRRLGSSDSLQMQALISSLQQKYKIPFVYATADPNLALRLADRIAIMHNGSLQQVDTASYIYDNPSNLFVASYFGMPQINLFCATLLKDDKKITVKLKTFELDMSIQCTKKLVSDSYFGKQIVLGVRPEDLTPHTQDIDQNCLHGTIKLIEKLGQDVLLYVLCQSEKNCVLVRSKNGDYKIGQQIGLSINVDRLNFFDKDTHSSIVGLPITSTLRGVVLRQSQQGAVLCLQDTTLVLSQQFCDRFVDTDMPMLLGLMPDKLFLDRGHCVTDCIGSLTVNVDFVDAGHNFVALYCTLCDARIAIKAESNCSVCVGDSISVFFDIDDIMLYSSMGDRLVAKRAIQKSQTIKIANQSITTDNKSFVLIDKHNKNQYKNKFACQVIDAEVLGDQSIMYFKLKDNSTVYNAIFDSPIPSHALGCTVRLGIGDKKN